VIQKKACVVVTGGCGYIGSHVVNQLTESGYDVVVIDNLSTGFSDALLNHETLYVGNVGDESLLDQVFSTHTPMAVLHFAASIAVEESVHHPLDYYQNNTSNFITLLKKVAEHKIPRVILSSTAAVYGSASDHPLVETSPLAPENPYGASKWMDERILQGMAASSSLQYVILRYFNVAGADLGLRLGQRTPNATHLIKVASEVAVGKRKSMAIFGTDYPTPDGSCIRDYIHVDDLARAHLAALTHLEQGHGSNIFNCGCNRGASVLEVLHALEGVLGHTISVEKTGRRPGDVAALTANTTKITTTMGWKPQHTSLEVIVRSALQWEFLLSGKPTA